MVELAQSEIANCLPTLLDRIDSQPVVISRNGEQIGAIVSIKLFKEINKIHRDRMIEISAEAGAKVAEHAAELGISPEQLVERLLCDED